MARNTIAFTCVALLLACDGPDSSTPSASCTPATFEVHAVDNDSAYMKRVSEHVGWVPFSGIGTYDKDAIAAGVWTDGDYWRGDDGTPYRDSYLEAADRAKLERYIAGLVAKPDFALPANRKLVVEAPDERHARWRTYYVDSTPVIDRSALDVAFVSSEYRDLVMIQLTADGTRRWATATSHNIERKMATLVDGTVLSAPILKGAITVGRTSIVLEEGPDRHEQATELAAHLSCTST